MLPALAPVEMVYRRDETGPLSVVRPTLEGFHLQRHFDQPDRSSQRAWSHLIIADDRMDVRDQEVLLCNEVRVRD